MKTPALREPIKQTGGRYMVNKISNPFKISVQEIDRKYDGCWVLYSYRDLNPMNGYCYILATGSSDESEYENDINEMDRLAEEDFNTMITGLQFGYKERGKEMLHVL
jgi:hypothetical protein